MTKEEIKALFTEVIWSNILKEYIVQEYGENKLISTEKVVIWHDEETFFLVGAVVIDNELYFLTRHEYCGNTLYDEFGHMSANQFSDIDESIIRLFIQNLVYDKKPHIEFDFETYEPINKWRIYKDWFFDNEESIREVIENKGYFKKEM